MYCLVSVVLGGCSPAVQSQEAKAGGIDLRGIDLSRTVVSLDGDWRLVWENRDTLTARQPGSWIDVKRRGRPLPQEGKAVYMLRILVDTASRERLVLSTKEINSESRIRVNGVLLPDIGRDRLHRILPECAGVIDLTISVQNELDIRPGIPCPVYLGTEAVMENRAAVYLGMQAAMVGVFGLLAILYMSSWVLSRKERASLLLGAYSLCWGVYSFFLGVEASPAEILFPTIPLVWTQKIYLLTTTFSFPMACWLWLAVFPSRMLHRALPVLYVSSLACAVCLLGFADIHWIWYEWYLVLGNLYMLLLLLAVLASVRKVELGARVFLVGLLVFFAVIAYGTLRFRGEWAGMGAFAIVLADSMVLKQRRTEMERVSLLKEELSGLVQQKFQSERREEQLGALLDQLDSPILVLREDDSVCYANKAVHAFLGSQENVLGKAWDQICVEERPMDNNLVACHLFREYTANQICVARKIDLDIGGESLVAMLFQTSIRAQDPIQEKQNSAGNLVADPHKLAKTVLKKSLQIWGQCTGLDKANFAETSTLWKVYIDSNGWPRTPTLDKYLELAKMPRLPKWRKVIDSADFVLATAKHRSWSDPTIQELKALRDLLEKMV